jgi:hypothetical protein
VINRKKGILIIQLTIFLVASALLYNTYSDKNEKEVEVSLKVEAETSPDTNSFTEVEYSGLDLAGNAYVLKATKANFKTETPELINMKEVVATFYLKDNTVLTVNSDEGLYNNVTLDMNFVNNVKVNYLTHDVICDMLSYSNSNGKLIATGNVVGESVQKGEFSADNVEYDIKNKTLNFSMFGSKQVNIKFKN